ncbi:MAG: hypothetical protein EBW66_06525 [Actinobacteria bacterium]|nr:hypothetical protein [Actinomycetota bacterium]
MSDLIKSSAFMALGTLLSRITGLIRGLLTVAVLGTALLGDTYNVGNTTPNRFDGGICTSNSPFISR